MKIIEELCNLTLLDSKGVNSSSISTEENNNLPQTSDSNDRADSSNSSGTVL